MAVTKLNASAPPYHSSPNHLRLSPPLFPPVPAWHTAPCPCPLPSPPAVVVFYHCASFPIPAPPYPCFLPPPQQTAAAAAVPSLCKAALPLLPHGCAPHRMMVSGGAGVWSEKLKAQAAANARAARTVEAKQEPAVPAAPRPRIRGASPPCGKPVQEQAGIKGRSKERVCRQGEPAAAVRARPAMSPSPVFTTRPPSLMPAPEWLERPVTTVMIRNIPSKLTPGEMMQLLDDHCARANKKKRGVARSAYDFLYLRMDFSVCSSNMGYAFVNLTTAEAARRLHYDLHGGRWKVFRSKKVIDIRAARIQGKDALVRHFSSSTFACHTDEFLPAVFSPPRDGAGDPSPSEPTRVGRRVPPPAPAVQQLAPAPRKHLTWRPVCIEEAKQ